jgi:hypothetical protein
MRNINPVCQTRTNALLTLQKTILRHRPFNFQGEGGLWFYASFRNIFSDNMRVRIFFFQVSTLGYMTKTLNQIFFSQPKSEYFFQQHWESEYLKKKKKKT